jgi:hypothetical protein
LQRKFYKWIICSIFCPSEKFSNVVLEEKKMGSLFYLSLSSFALF